MEQKLGKKMFVQIVKQLRELIAEQQIQPGQKLPSERVLCEQLNASRSTIREALRSLELLGLIESKHGGGTFLANAGDHRLIEILASFILQQEKSMEDVHATREMHEREAIRLICQQQALRALPIWDSLFTQIELEQELMRDVFLQECIIATGNRLSLKIWLQLMSYSAPAYKKIITKNEKQPLQILLKSIQMGYEQEAMEAFSEWINRI